MPLGALMILPGPAEPRFPSRSHSSLAQTARVRACPRVPAAPLVRVAWVWDLPVGSGCGLSYLVQLGWHAPSPARSSRREFGEFAIRGRRLFEDAAGCLFSPAR